MQKAAELPHFEAATHAGTAGKAPLIALGLALALLWFVCCRHLSTEWRFNEQYSYGWFVPFFALYLFWLRWEDRGRRKGEGGRMKSLALSVFVLSALILLPLRVFEIANPDWRPLGWVHGMAAAAITLSIIYLAGGRRWLRHFSFPILFFFTSVPWPSPIEQPIVQGLMRGIAGAAAETVSLFGVPAEVQGNLIHLSNGVVGVSEACSGVRSLQTSLMIGLLFGELRRLTFPKRVLLVLTAIAIALLANFGRSLFLVSIAARENIAAVERWHDVAGYAIVALVFAGTMWTASSFAKAEGGRMKDERAGRLATNQKSAISIQHFPFSVPAFQRFSFLLLFWFLAIEVAAEGWYRIHERDSVAQPSWNVRWPDAASDVHERKIDDGVRETLRYDSAREASCKVSLPDKTDARTFIYFFRWDAGSSSTVLRARAHRPDICLPAAGWEQIADKGYEDIPVAPGLTLPVRRVTFAQPRSGLVAHTYFCLQEDAVNPHDSRTDLSTRNGVQPDWAAPARWRVVRDGIRNRGQQVLEVIMLTPAQVTDAVADKRFEELLRRLVNSH